ncbi:MAG: pyruvate kinase [Christensenellaceae bacterium]|nr:pyruvate kinase [Christensenellaceae bacterium]
MNAKTKVICTMGPASWSPEMMEKLMKAGMSIARFNMSHAWTPELVEAAKKQMQQAQQISKKLGLKVEVALDTKGPDVRIGTFKDPKVDIVAGQTFKFYFGEKNRKHVGDVNGVFVDYEKLLRIVKVGSQLALNDGHVVMNITEIKDSVITCKVLAGGVLKNRKSLAAPGHDLELPFISPEDEIDFKMGTEVGVDWIMASAVAKPQDVIDLRNWLDKNGGKSIKIMSKPEDRIALKNIDGIIKASDAIMVPRGGLGTDIGLENIAVAQKQIVAKTRKAKKPVVVATEMLESMAEKPNPTRAEATDVANAVWDGATHVMLSCETAAGKYPVESVEFLVKTAVVAESHKEYYRV